MDSQDSHTLDKELLSLLLVVSRVLLNPRRRRTVPVEIEHPAEVSTRMQGTAQGTLAAAGGGRGAVVVAAAVAVAASEGGVCFAFQRCQRRPRRDVPAWEGQEQRMHSLESSDP